MDSQMVDLLLFETSEVADTFWHCVLVYYRSDNDQDMVERPLYQACCVVDVASNWCCWDETFVVELLAI